MTKLIINDEENDINTRKLEYLGAGKHGRVYAFGDKALKIYRRRLVLIHADLLNAMRNRAKLFTTYDVKGWRFPTDLALKKEHIGGYLYDLVKDTKSLVGIQNIAVEDLIEQTIITKDGSDKIALEYHTAINDARPRNFLWNGEFNHIDCDQYCYRPNADEKELQHHNRIEMYFLIRDVLFPNNYYQDARSMKDLFDFGYSTFTDKYNGDKTVFVSDYIEYLQGKTKVKTFGEIGRAWDK